jgi:cob(I)alamin adenosyltransferase
MDDDRAYKPWTEVEQLAKTNFHCRLCGVIEVTDTSEGWVKRHLDGEQHQAKIAEAQNKHLVANAERSLKRQAKMEAEQQEREDEQERQWLREEIERIQREEA